MSSNNSVEDCKKECLRTKRCTAFNYATEKGGCTLRACRLPFPPIPEAWIGPYYKGYFYRAGPSGEIASN